jgi:uncharacterized protein
MTEPHWRAAVMDYIRREAVPPDKFAHQPRLYELACRIGEGLEYDDDILFAAAWMHDLGVFAGHRPQEPSELARWDHVPYTIARTRELLVRWGVPPEKVDAVAEAIRTHQPKDKPGIVEAVLLRDADILEQLGAVGITRALVKVGRDTRYETAAAVVPVLRRAAEELPGKLHLKTARKLAAPRLETLRDFIASLEGETDGLRHL